MLRQHRNVYDINIATDAVCGMWLSMQSSPQKMWSNVKLCQTTWHSVHIHICSDIMPLYLVVYEATKNSTIYLQSTWIMRAQQTKRKKKRKRAHTLISWLVRHSEHLNDGVFGDDGFLLSPVRVQKPYKCILHTKWIRMRMRLTEWSWAEPSHNDETYRSDWWKIWCALVLLTSMRLVDETPWQQH